MNIIITLADSKNKDRFRYFGEFGFTVWNIGRFYN